MGRLIEMELLKSLSRPSHIENGKEIKEIFDLFGFFGMNNGGWCLMDWWLLLACEWLVGYGRCSANGSAKESEPSQEEKPINSNQTKQFKENERKTIELERQLIEEWNQWSAFNWLSEVRPQPTGGKWNQSILLLLARGAPSKRRVEWLISSFGSYGRRQLNGRGTAVGWLPPRLLNGSEVVICLRPAPFNHSTLLFDGAPRANKRRIDWFHLPR